MLENAERALCNRSRLVEADGVEFREGLEGFAAAIGHDPVLCAETDTNEVGSRGSEGETAGTAEAMENFS